jgi:xylose isomerase
MSERNFAAILGVLGKPADRFMSGGYKALNPDVFEKIRMIGHAEAVKSVELIQGDGDDIHAGNYKQVQAALKDQGLQICAINPNLWGERQWATGTLGARDPQIRQQAVERIRSAMDLAVEVGCDYVGLWPGQDGYDYLFEADYEQMYDWWVAGVQTCADHNPRIKLGLEYKPYEPRTHSFISTATKTLLLLGDIDRQNAGLTMDIGHALYAHENLGEAVSLAQRWGKLFHIHLNDNYADWDWDLNFGAVHLLDFIEFIYWLKRTGYEGWYSVDIFPYRTDGIASVSESLAWLETLMDLVERLGLPALTELIACGDPIQVSRFLRQALFPGK